MSDLYGLSSQDVSDLKWMYNRLTALFGNPRLRGSDAPRIEDSDHLPPEVYLAFIPDSGIPGAQPGPGGTLMLHGVDCAIDHILGDITPTATPIPLTKHVLNPSLLPLPGNQWIPIMRDKFGSWLAQGTPISVGTGTGITIIEQFFGFPIYVNEFLEIIPCNYPSALKLAGPPYPGSVISTLSGGWGMDFIDSTGYSTSGELGGTPYSTTPGLGWNATYDTGGGDTGTNCTARVQPRVTYPPANSYTTINNNYYNVGGVSPIIDFGDSCSIYFVAFDRVSGTSGFHILEIEAIWKGLQAWGNWDGTQGGVNVPCGSCVAEVDPADVAIGFDFRTTGFGGIEWNPCDFLLDLGVDVCPPTAHDSLKTVRLKVKTAGATKNVIFGPYLKPDCTTETIELCYYHGQFIGWFKNGVIQ